jgi:hypothetical protein
MSQHLGGKGGKGRTPKGERVWSTAVQSRAQARILRQSDYQKRLAKVLREQEVS